MLAAGANVIFPRVAWNCGRASRIGRPSSEQIGCVWSTSPGPHSPHAAASGVCAPCPGPNHAFIFWLFASTLNPSLPRLLELAGQAEHVPCLPRVRHRLRVGGEHPAQVVEVGVREVVPGGHADRTGPVPLTVFGVGARGLRPGERLEARHDVGAGSGHGSSIFSGVSGTSTGGASWSSAGGGVVEHPLAQGCELLALLRLGLSAGR